MASLASDAPGPGERYRTDQRFFVNLSQGIAAFIAFGFIQWSARGMVDIGTVPIWVHLHGLAMVSFLILFLVQNRLADSGSLALHRRLGWAGLLLALAIAPLGSFTGVMAVELHRVPPFFSNAHFIALTWVEAILFSATVCYAILRRRETEWHRRMMLAALVLIMEPAFGRLLPMPFLHGWGHWIIMALQLGVLGIAMRHDRSVRGSVHPALWAGTGLIIGSAVIIALLAQTSPLIAWAEALAVP